MSEYRLTISASPAAHARLQAEWQIRQAWRAAYPDAAPITGAVALAVNIYVAQPAAIPQYRRHIARPTTRPGINTYLETALDALNGVAFINDSQVVSVAVHKNYAVNRPPHWEIQLTPLPEPVRYSRVTETS